MRVVGIDCGVRQVALYVLDEDLTSPGDHILEVGKCYRGEELYHLRDMLQSDLENNWKPDRVYIEDAIVAGARNLRTSIQLAQTVGMVLSLGYQGSLVPVSSWKKQVIGNGNAKKEDVAAWYADFTGQQSRSQDIADAAAIAHYGQHLLEVAGRLADGGYLGGEGGQQVPQHGQDVAGVARGSVLSGEPGRHHLLRGTSER